MRNWNKNKIKINLEKVIMRRSRSERPAQILLGQQFFQRVNHIMQFWYWEEGDEHRDVSVGQHERNNPPDGD